MAAPAEAPFGAFVRSFAAAAALALAAGAAVTVFVDPLFELWLSNVQQGGAGGEDAPV